jgi:cbb3-type cytochrome oxidase cytochrome c subunit
MTYLRKFLLGLAAAFGVPWLVMVIHPVLTAQKLEPLPYDKDRDGIEGVYPGAGIYRQGQLVYVREGCTQCHTQVIRDSQHHLGYNGIMDGWKKGWGSDQSAEPRHVTRANTPYDYIGEPVAPLGVQRTGPDLANFGYRASDRAEVHVQLYAPQAHASWSVMPGFRHLYIVRKIEGKGSANALDLPEPFAPKKGFEIVPTRDAEELVEYLLSLKKDSPVPGKVIAESDQ